MDSSNKSTLRKRLARTPLAALSALSLAVGTLIVPSLLTSEAAAAANFTGGIRDKSGAVEKDAQKASDLPAGSCVVDSGEPSGSQAGFSWNTLEPGATSPDKKAWGLSVSFDNSKDRTFADWYFSSSGNLKNFLDPGQVASMEVGQTFIDKNVTRKADEIVEITASGRDLRNVNLYADLTDEKVKQFASASADNPVRYAWQSNYKKDNPEGPYATQGGNATFTATVNPWPSENIECNPITVSWESQEKLVIRPDEKLKVGKINVPAVTGDGTDDSMSRMVVEAYDAQGNFIGTSDTDASGGGTPSVSIDQDTGEIFYTMPKYKGTDLSDQQGMRFSVLAKPRTVEQLQAASDNNGGVGKAFDSSNSLDRYSNANVLANHQWSFDDTQFHNPAYDPDQQAIISGVEDNKPTTERQVVTFKEAGDKIADLVKKREDGGFEAEVKLDKKNVYSGWEAKMDPDTYEVTVTAPLNPAPGTFAQPRVIVTYSNGSRDIIPLLVTVDHNNTQVSELQSPGTTKGIPGQDIEAELTVGKVIDDYGPFDPKSYEVVPGTVPEGWTVTVDKDGKVIAKSAQDAPNFSTITPKIRATYPDGTIDEVDVSFQVVNNVKVPDYTAVSGKAEEEVKLQPVMPPVGLGGKETDEEPNRYTFEDGSTEYKVGDWTVTIDEDTGELTSTIPKSALPGAQLTVPVKAHYKSGANPQIATGTISVIGEGSGEDNAFYRPQLTKAGEPVKSDITTLLDDPKKATYKLPPKNQWPKDWDFTIDESGTITATPGENVPNGTTITIPVEVTYPDGSKASVPADFTVVDAYSRANQPSYPTVTGDIGTTVKSQVDRTHLSEDSEPRFSLVTDPEDPDYIAPPRNLTWDQVKIDPETGEITTPIGANVLPGSSADIPVRVTYKDGSRDFTIATVVAKGKHRQIYEPKYELKTTKPGVGKASPILDDTKVPERDLAEDKSKRFSAPDKVEGWKITIDESGIVTATPPADAKAGDGIQVPVTVTYLDGSTDTVFAPFKVIEEQKDVNEPYYSVEVTGPGAKVKRPIKPNDIPAGSKFNFGVDGDQPITETKIDGWDYKINPETGEISVTPPADAKPGDKHDHKVTVTYPDGSVDEVPVSTIVKLTNKWEAEPTYPVQTVYPGDTATLPVTLDKPDNVNVANYKLGDVPAGWNVSIDDNGQITATAPADAEPGDQVKIPVTVTYEDGSTDTAYAVVNVVDVPKREVPFKVEYKYDDSIPAGKYKVETKGEPGAEKQKKDGTWEQTKAPVNEVVVVGTKPAESAKEVTWKVPIPYPTEVRENPNLAPGETKVVQEGKDGEKTFTARFNAKGDKAEVAEEKTTREPVTRIVEYGPRLGADELVTKTEKPIPFETEVEFDPNLPAGEKVVDQKGELGTEVETSTQKLVDGKPSGDPTVTTERTKEPTTEKIRVGTKTEGTHTTSYEKDVPFETEIIFDENLEAGRQETVQEGKLGKDKVTTTQTIVNSKVTDTKTETERVTEPVKRIVKVGTKGKPASTTVEWTENTPFEVEVRVNPELKPGETKVVQEGKQGEVKHTVKVNAENGEISKDESTEEISKPTKQIIEVGPATEHQTELTDKHTENTAYDTIIEYDPNLEVGKVVEDQAGVYGEKEITKTWKLKNGKPEGDPEVSEKVIKDPQPRKIRVGAKCNCDEPTEEPTPEPTQDPTDEPSEEPSETPSEEPTEEPTDEPSDKPSDEPSEQPSETPSEEPTEKPTEEPSDKPSEEPSEEPSETPSEEPTPEPTQDPTDEPSEEPGPEPTDEPSDKPSDEPSEQPSETPSEEPTPEPTQDPTDEPSEEPGPEPTEEPSDKPSDKPSEEPTEEPSDKPSDEPSGQPSEEPSDEPGKPGDSPSDEPNDPGKPGQPGDGSDGPGNSGDSSEPGDSGKPGPLPRTGTEVALAVAMGLGMIGAGIALTVASRRNRRS